MFRVANRGLSVKELELGLGLRGGDTAQLMVMSNIYIYRSIESRRCFC